MVVNQKSPTNKYYSTFNTIFFVGLLCKSKFEHLFIYCILFFIEYACWNKHNFPFRIIEKHLETKIEKNLPNKLAKAIQPKSNFSALKHIFFFLFIHFLYHLLIK